MARMPRPWYRANRGQWYATVNNVQTPLEVTDPRGESEAWEALRKLVGVAVREQIDAPKAISKTKPGTITTLIAQFMSEHVAALADSTRRSYVTHLRWLGKSWGGETVDSLPVTSVCHSASKVPTWSDTYRANVLTSVAAFLRWCGRAEKIAAPPKASRGAEALIPEEVYKRCLRETHGDFRQILRVLWLTACRPAEVTGLTVEAVDWASGTATLKQHKTRHRGKTRILFLGAEAVKVLGEQREKYESGLLFRGLRGKRIGLQALTKRFIRLSVKVGHPMRAYDFRHTAATRMLSMGISDVHVAAILGHASTAMIHKHYSHINAQARLLKEVADKLAG